MKTAVLKYSELRALLYPVIPHAGTDDMLPVLCQIPITEHGGYLVAQATNRFTAAFKRVKPEKKAPKGFATSIEIRAAKKLLTLLRPTRGHDPAIELRADGDKIHVQTETSGFQFGFAHVGFTLDVLLVGSTKFPDVASLLPTDLTTTVSEQAFDYDLFTTFKAALDGRGRYEQTLLIRMGATPAKPMLVTVDGGDNPRDFVGMIMPRRIIGEHSLLRQKEHFPQVLESWAATLGRAS